MTSSIGFGQRLRARTMFSSSERRPLGAFVTATDAATTAVLASAGMDFVVIDQEHAPIDQAALIGHVRAANAGGTVPLVRVPENAREHIQAALDAGAQGVVIPRVSSAEDVAQALLAARYQAGGRGRNPAIEPAGWALDPQAQAQFRRDSNAQVLCIPLIETAAAVANLDEIAAIPGIDVILVGFGDLAQDLELDPSSDSDRLVEIWQECVRIVHKHGGVVGCDLNPKFQATDFSTLSSDLRLLMLASTRAIEEARKDAR